MKIFQFQKERFNLWYNEMLTTNSEALSTVCVGLPYSGRFVFLRVYYTYFYQYFVKNHPNLELHFLDSDNIVIPPYSKDKEITVINISLKDNLTAEKVKEIINKTVISSWDIKSRYVFNLFVSPDEYLFDERVTQLLPRAVKTFFFKGLSDEELLELKPYLESKSGRKISDAEILKVGRAHLRHYFLLKHYYLNNCTISQPSREIFNEVQSSFIQLILHSTEHSKKVLSSLRLNKTLLVNAQKKYSLYDSGSKKVFLTSKEKKFLQYAEKNDGLIESNIVSKIVQGRDNKEDFATINPNSLQKFVSRLREKLNRSNSPIKISSVRGVGYLVER